MDNEQTNVLASYGMWQMRQIGAYGDDDNDEITGGKRIFILPVFAPDNCAINDGTNDSKPSTKCSS
jgi:hypothetical protein